MDRRPSVESGILPVTVGFQARVLADSISPDGHRLTTLEVTFPRFILAEFNTHRAFSRNSASSRAIPVTKQIRRVLESPYVPIEFGSNQPGMQAGPALTGKPREDAEEEWLSARDDAVRHVLALTAKPGVIGPDDDLLPLLEEIEAAVREGKRSDHWLNVHKQVANRLLEPFMWHTVIVTATEWENFWHLRAHPDAQPEIQRTARMMLEAREASEATTVEWGGWHLPLIDDADREAPEVNSGEDLAKISAGRCARVSYLTHAGKRDLGADLELHDRLVAGGHMSPLEHPAQPLSPGATQTDVWSGNFRGWRSYRKRIPFEENPLGQESISGPAEVTVEPAQDGSKRTSGRPSQVA